MKYVEVVIGPPGSGKSTYVIKKKTTLSHRNLFVVNLDPGNYNDSEFDYSICSLFSSHEYQKQYDVGPNMSVKAILEKFGSNIETFFKENLEDSDHYFILDFPGQIEFFICNNILNDILKYLRRHNCSIVVVCLVDLVFFVNIHAQLSSYLVSTLCLCLLEAAQICVISKCDNWNIFEFKQTLRDIAELHDLENLVGENRYHQEVASFIKGQGLLLYEILDYENQASVSALQMTIDRASGFFFEDDYFVSENTTTVHSRDDVFSKYEDNS